MGESEFQSKQLNFNNMRLRINELAKSREWTSGIDI